ncbi:Glycosyltransferase involved in cell wall bisynthesis [Arsukibacterium tuosuense]|uniref:Glycosyltransferase involved in cell wall bisynthesis n=1 Tax=Arsukibacterium tuosuense TaxID=1323745 RepID=A0A285IBG6_9GAMM|nr:glycosyltransferase family 4 protein [Arsukibacterium tuosuense]SNY44396.1 Glycosyltransferase involved in cell wall bisynthesis [Arsukibacterium tuosuense]
MDSKTLNSKPSVLIITNMGPKPAAPFQGLFVRQQVDALASLQPGYHFMRWHTDSRLNRLLKYPVFFADFVWRFLFTRHKYMILHVHFFYPTIWLALLYKALRNPAAKIVVTCHGSDIYKYQPPGFWYRWCATKVQHWIFTSRALQNRFSLDCRQSTVLSAGIADSFASSEQLDFSSKTIDLLYVGSLDHNKGIDRLIALLPYLKGKKVVIAGMGPMLKQLNQAVTPYPDVRILGPQTANELAGLYQQARCFISLSRNESFGLVMAEAMACYTPVVATFTDGAAAQLRSDENGFLVAQNSEQTPLNEQQLIAELQSALSKVWQLSPARYQQMQLAARAWAEQCLVSDVAAKLINLYQEM